MRVGTPQLFSSEKLTLLLNKVELMKTPPTDEAALFESSGMEVGYSWGNPVNFKITTASDLEIARAIVERRERQ
jgi:2-C-methyl-D-erythritol 4-phosphate cytidylyltransferase